MLSIWQAGINVIKFASTNCIKRHMPSICNVKVIVLDGGLGMQLSIEDKYIANGQLKANCKDSLNCDICLIIHQYNIVTIPTPFSKMRQLTQLFPNAEAVIFDFDGTLARTEAVWQAVDKDVYDYRGINRDLYKYYSMINGKAILDVARVVVEEYKIDASPENIARELKDAYVRHVHDASFLPGAVDFMKGLKSAQVGYAIASANPRELNELVFSSNSQYALVPDVFLSCEDVPRGKPHPDIFILAAERIGVDIRNCVVFEDSEVGLRAARASGALVVRVAGHSSVDFEQIDSSFYDLLISDFIEVSW